MRLRTFLAVAVASVGLFLAAPATSAVAYPPTTCPTLSVSTTTPLEGASFTVSGTNFKPNAHVSLELHTKVYVLARVTVSAQGTFSVSVKMPAGLLGAHVIIAVGGGGTPGCPSDPVQAITVQAAAASSGAGGGSGGGGGTAFTGVDVLLLVLAGGALVAAGFALNRGSGKRRRLYPNELG